MAALHERVWGVVGGLEMCGELCVLTYVFLYMMDDGPWMIGRRFALALGREEGFQIPGAAACVL